MLAKHWKRIGLIILIIACFANITSKFVKKVSFNDNVKSTVKNVVTNVDETVQNTVNSVKSEFTNDKKDTNQENSTPANTTVQNQNPVNQQVGGQTNQVQTDPGYVEIPTEQNNTFVIQETQNGTN